MTYHIDEQGEFLEIDPDTRKRLFDAARKLDDPRILVAGWLADDRAGIAMDRNGEWYAYAKKPMPEGDRWRGARDDVEPHMPPLKIPYDGDWRESWTPRPERPLLCPWCGAPVAITKTIIDELYFYKCVECGMDGPVSHTEGEAVKNCRRMYDLLTPIREEEDDE
jgi:hypothetical protein